MASTVSLSLPHLTFSLFPPQQAEVKPDVNSVDSKSLQGSFGWEKVGDIVLPVIFREEEKLVPVRIVESKVSCH